MVIPNGKRILSLTGQSAYEPASPNGYEARAREPERAKHDIRAIPPVPGASTPSGGANSCQGDPTPIRRMGL